MADEEAASNPDTCMNCLLPGIEPLCRSADLIPVLASMEHEALKTRAR